MDTVMTSAFDRIRMNARDPLMRRNVGLLMLGKLIGLAAVLVLIHELMPGVAHAQDGADTPDPVASINACTGMTAPCPPWRTSTARTRPASTRALTTRAR